MTQEQLELLNQLYHQDNWVVVKQPDGKSAVVEGRVKIAVADEKSAADLIVKIRNTYTALVEELAKVKAKDKVRGGTFGVDIQGAVNEAVEEAVAETLEAVTAPTIPGEQLP